MSLSILVRAVSVLWGDLKLFHDAVFSEKGTVPMQEVNELHSLTVLQSSHGVIDAKLPMVTSLYLLRSSLFSPGLILALIDYLIVEKQCKHFTPCCRRMWRGGGMLSSQSIVEKSIQEFPAFSEITLEKYSFLTMLKPSLDYKFLFSSVEIYLRIKEHTMMVRQR